MACPTSPPGRAPPRGRARSTSASLSTTSPPPPPTRAPAAPPPMAFPPAPLPPPPPAARAAPPPPRPWIEAPCQTAPAPSLAPAGRHVVSLFCQCFPPDVDAEAAADAAVARFTEVCPTFPD